MIPGTTQHPFGQILDRTAQALDITPALYDRVQTTHEEVGEWLGGDGSPLQQFDPTIYPHGSFLLGTVNRPLTDEDYCDVDSISRLQIRKDGMTRREVKKMVGDRLKQHPDYCEIIEECRTCWTLRFDKHFRMDVLPAIPNTDRPPEGILITDKEDTRWLWSNPVGFAEWFHQQMRVEHDRLVMAHRADVQPIPKWRIKTPLQRAVQLLKRHRDIRFELHDEELKPLSIIITTLAAKAYDNQADLLDAMEQIVRTMRDHIERRDGLYWVENPANAGENFASSWNEDKRKADAFYGWLDVVEEDFDRTLEQKGLHNVRIIAANSYGRSTVQRAFETIGKQTLIDRHNGKVGVTPGTGVITVGSGLQIRPHRNFGDASY